MSIAWLDHPLTTSAFGWRLERADGVTLGFTSHDRDIWIDGLLYSARPGMEPSSIVENMGFESGGLDVRGALTSDAIRQDDLLAGRWNGARLEIFLFDWASVDDGRQSLAIGELGTVSFSGDAFEAELIGVAKRLDRPAVPATSPGCRAVFCDKACGLNRERFRHVATVIAASGCTMTLSGAPPVGADALEYGQMRWLDGPNCGLIEEILSHDAENVRLANPPSFMVTDNARVELVEGCDKRLETCSARFANALNFRGEPHLPGNDLLTRFPGG